MREHVEKRGFRDETHHEREVDFRGSRESDSGRHGWNLSRYWRVTGNERRVCNRINIRENTKRWKIGDTRRLKIDG